jgi:hypothetical protein
MVSIPNTEKEKTKRKKKRKMKHRVKGHGSGRHTLAGVSIIENIFVLFCLKTHRQKEVKINSQSHYILWNITLTS